MTNVMREASVTEGMFSLEMRWILRGQLDTAMANRFAGVLPEMEAREDVYLLDPDLGSLSVKIRAGAALEVKAFRGSPGVLEIPGRARGQLQYWQKWSFPFSPLSWDGGDFGAWIRVRKQRRISRWSLTDGRITAPARNVADAPRCAVELTEIRTHGQDWWSLGLEAIGPADLLGTRLEATAALMFTQSLPGGVELRLENSTSYAEWLACVNTGDDRRAPGGRAQWPPFGRCNHIRAGLPGDDLEDVGR